MGQQLLQNRINELNSGILNYVVGKVYITGFFNEDRLNSFVYKGTQNWSSKGVYNREEITFSKIKDYALFIVKKDGETIDKHQFIPVYKGVLKYKNKPNSVTITIRKNTFNDQINLLTEKEAIIFKSKKELDQFLENEFAITIEI